MKSDGNTEWMYNGKVLKSIKDIPSCCPFAVYTIEFSDGTYYFGSKQIYNIRNVKLSKKRANELWSGKGRKPVKEIKVTESDWLKYKSSSKLVNEKLSNGEKANFYILQFYDNKNDMLLHEARLIIESFLLRDKNCLNGWVSIRKNKPK